MMPVWLYASYRLNKELRSRQVPLLALAAAFSFVIMMFNIPMPGGTSGHMVGAALIAIILGPWAAVVTMTVTLAIQAFVMRDGGVTALGANCFTMAFLMPVCAYVIYRLISGSSSPLSKRRLAGAVVAAYLSIIVAGVATGYILGAQNVIYPPINGQAQYFPYDIGISVPAMLVDSLFFGIFEAILTGLVFVYIQKNDPSLIAGKKMVSRGTGAGTTAVRPNKHLIRNLIIGLLVLIILTPLGLIATGTPFGEWDASTIKDQIGYIPSGMGSGIADLWNSPMADYGIAGVNAPVGYILAALVGVALCGGLAYLAMRWTRKKEQSEE
jgi:cobalt/nickel transport system permease protein